MIPKEIEYKFLFFDENVVLPQLAQASKSIKLMQGYTIDGIRFTQRVHEDNTKDYKINYKLGMGVVRDEAQCQIDENVFIAIWPLTIGRRVYKTRYHFPLESGLILELDVYQHSRKWPLITGEIEFATEEEADNYSDTELGRFGSFLYVTGDSEYLNINLAC
jgi:CYTH domain-containing protein